jgi:hypothetical protein
MIVIDGMLVRSPITGAAASKSTASAPSPKTAGCFHIVRPQLWSMVSIRPWWLGSLTLRRDPTAAALMRVPSRPSTAGSSVRVAASTATTESMIPRAMLRKAGLGTRRIAASEASTVTALKATALPAVSIVSATAATTTPWSPGTAPRRFSAARNRTTRKRA